jgi:AcrR family transcriptional regulator
METKMEKSIISAFLELCLEKDSQKVSVKEICTRAGVSRAIFYRYFERVEQLLATLEEQCNENFRKNFEAMAWIDLDLLKEKEGFPLFHNFYSYFEQNKTLFRVLFMSPRYVTYCAEKWRLGYLKKFMDKMPKATAEPLSAFLAGGILHTVMLWVADQIETKPRYLTKMTTAFVGMALDNSPPAGGDSRHSLS